MRKQRIQEAEIAALIDKGEVVIRGVKYTYENKGIEDVKVVAVCVDKGNEGDEEVIDDMLLTSHDAVTFICHDIADHDASLIKLSCLYNPDREQFVVTATLIDSMS